MKKTFKTLTALLATATLAFGLTACNDKKPAKTGQKQFQALSKYKKMAKYALVYLAINHHLVMLMHKAKAKALMLKLVKRSVKIY